LPRVPEPEEVEDLQVAQVEEAQPEVAVEEVKRVPERENARPEGFADKMKDASDDLVVATEAEEQVDGRVKEAAETVKLDRARTMAEKAVQTPNKAPQPQAPARAVSSAPAPAAVPGEPTDQPAAEMDAEEEIGNRVGGIGGGAFRGSARDGSEELPEVPAAEMEAREVAPGRRRLAVPAAPVESKKKGKVEASGVALDAAAGRMPAQASVPQPGPDETKDQSRADAIRSSASAEAVGAEKREMPKAAAKPFGWAGGKDREVVLRQYYRKSLTLGIEPVYAENLLWQPLLLTDVNGQASIQFELPSVVTTYRVLVDGHVDGRIGSGEGKVVSETSQD